MAKPKKSADPVVQPTPAARVVRGIAFKVARKPEGIVSPVTTALQKVAKSAKSLQAQLWGVFPVHGLDVVIAGYLSARTPRQSEATWMVEPGGTLAREHFIVGYTLSDGASVGPLRDERCDLDCVEDFIHELSTSEAWNELGAAPFDAKALPGGEVLDSPHEPAWFLLSDDGRGGDVVFGMSFWRPGAEYSEGRVQTWTRPVGDDDAVRVVGVRAARVDRETPLRVAPVECSYEREGWRSEAIRETRAVLDSQRSFAWYFVADRA